MTTRAAGSEHKRDPCTGSRVEERAPSTARLVGDLAAAESRVPKTLIQQTDAV
jgi:hypothetical protein